MVETGFEPVEIKIENASTGQTPSDPLIVQIAHSEIEKGKPSEWLFAKLIKNGIPPNQALSLASEKIDVTTALLRAEEEVIRQIHAASMVR